MILHPWNSAIHTLGTRDEGWRSTTWSRHYWLHMVSASDNSAKHYLHIIHSVVSGYRPCRHFSSLSLNSSVQLAPPLSSWKWPITSIFLIVAGLY